MFSKVFIALLLLSVALCQRVDVQTIDPFVPDTDNLVVLIGSTTVFPATLFASTQSSEILGGERDLILNVTGGLNGRLISTGVLDGTWIVTTPTNATAVVTMQYDGTDNSLALNTLGLQADFTLNGGDAFRLNISTDIDTTYTLRVYGLNGGQSSYDLSVVGDPDVFVNHFAFYTDFTGNANFSAVGALEIIIAGNQLVDTVIDSIHVSAGPQVSPTPTPSSPPPPPPPGFTWYTIDDDFGREPCEEEEPKRSYFVSNGNIVYYYFYRAYYEPVVYIINSSSSLAPFLFATVLAVLVAAF